MLALAPPPLVLESLDEHEALLQALAGNRFVGFFEEAIGAWRGKLAKVCTVTPTPTPLLTPNPNPTHITNCNPNHDP